MQVVQVAAGLYWVSIPEVDFFMQCGCMQDSVKYLIQRGCIEQTEQDGLTYETGPNAVLLSDTTLQGGHFSNLAEFPVAHMYFHQGQGLPGHPNYCSRKPLLVGSSEQITAQLHYIHRGKYGLTSKEELLATGMSSEDAAFHWNVKMEFAAGEIKQKEELLDTIVLADQETQIRDGISIRREAINRFTIRFREDSAQVDLSIPSAGRYPAPYPLGFHDVTREYFAIVHSGQGDGWDINRPAMASILVYQGKIYLIDAGPNVAYSLIALGIGVNEIEGVFNTHCHDDHFAGLSALMYRDLRVKYYATPFVRASVVKKFAALLSRPQEDFYALFDVQDINENSWNNLDGLEVRPVLSPHPVETTTFHFRTHHKGTDYTYAHLADIVSKERLLSISNKLSLTHGSRIDAINDQYFSSVHIKKIDIGASEIHGIADDFQDDKSERLILAHTKTPLTNLQKEIGSSAPFGTTDTLVVSNTDYYSEAAYSLLADNLTGIPEKSLRELHTNAIITLSPGTIILKRGVPSDHLYLVVTGSVESINHVSGASHLFSSGSLIGELYQSDRNAMSATYRTINFVHALKIPKRTYYRLMEGSDIGKKLAKLSERREFMGNSWLFSDALSLKMQLHIAEHLQPFSLPKPDSVVDMTAVDVLFIVTSGTVERTYQGKVIETLGSYDFFGEASCLFSEEIQSKYRVASPVKGYTIEAKHIKDIPVVRWKLLETHLKRVLSFNESEILSGIYVKKIKETANGTKETKVALRLKNLISANQYFAEIESLEDLFPRMLELAKNITEAEAASLLLYNPQQNILEFSSIADEVLDLEHLDSLRKSIKVKLGEGISGWVAKERKPLIVNDVQNDPRFLKIADKKSGITTRNLICVPLIYDDDLLGVLNVLNSKTKKLFDEEDQEILLSYAYLASVAIIRSRLIQTRLSQQRLEIQMATAAKIQSMFWPQIPELGYGSHVWATSRPASFVGGDLYDFLPLGDGSWVMYVADVADKGLPAAMVMVALWSKIRSEVSLHSNIEELLEAVNDSMHDLLSNEGFFATIILGRYWPEDGTLNLVRGGHLNPLWINSGRIKKIPKLIGVSLGITRQVHYRKEQIHVSPGESILFISDGVTEAENGRHQLFGEKRLLEHIQSVSGPPWSNGILHIVKDWQGKAAQSDDLTLLEIWRDEV